MFNRADHFASPLTVKDEEIQKLYENLNGFPAFRMQFPINSVTTIRRHGAGGLRKGMNVRIGSTLLVLAGLAPFPLMSQDWPMLGGATHRNMVSAMRDLP
ncbi:MAG TPA: hypothetical protein VL361_02940, partial [Candidatus Limnocylindrales bacterium]|nr:hypothetical protein [Candidatus Limnocylindrales bacterium]